jgi:hypothetical protein
MCGMSTHRLPASTEALSPAEMTPPATPLPRTTGRDPGARNRLNDELWLVEMVLRIERDRTIALAERWGHVGFANFLRERMAGNAALGE